MNRCPDRDTLLALLADRGTVAPEVRSHVGSCASCRAAMGRLLGVFYVAAAYKAFCSGETAGNSGDLFSGNDISSDALRTIFNSVDAAYRQRFEQQSEDDRRRLDAMGRMVDLATTPAKRLSADVAMPSGLAESIFENVDREYQRRFAAASPVVQQAAANQTIWSRPVRWMTAAVLLIAMGAGVLTSVDYFSSIGDQVVVEPQPEIHALAEDKLTKQDEPIETPDAAINDPDIQRLVFKWQDIERAQQQSLVFLQQRLSEAVAMTNRLSSLRDEWRRYPDDTLLRARQAILKRDYQEADYWLQKRLLAIDVKIISESRVPVLLARLECQRRQIELKKSEQPAKQFERLMEIYVELVEQVGPPRSAIGEKARNDRDRVHREAVRLAHVATDAQRPVEVVTLLWPWRERLDVQTRGMLVTARRDMNRQFDRLIGTGQLAATHKVESWIRSRYLQVSTLVEPGS